MRHIDDIEKDPKKATKLVCKCDYIKYPKRFWYLKLPTLPYRRSSADVIYVFKLYLMENTLAKPWDTWEYLTKPKQEGTVEILISYSSKEIFLFRYSSLNIVPGDIIGVDSTNGFK